MRLGGLIFSAERSEDLVPLCEKLDIYGLSAIRAPSRLAQMPDDECAQYGAQAQALGLVIGEYGVWENLLTDDRELRDRRIGMVRTLLLKADAMGCRSVVSLVGTKDPSDRPLAPHPYLYTEACRAEFREVVLRILDGLDLKRTKYIVEPWHNTFFYQPEDIRAFLDRVDHPHLGLHLDQMNMVNQAYFYDTTTLIHKTFALLADAVVSVHLKDIRCDFRHMFLKWDEVYIGDGVMDYDTYLRHLDALPPDITCYCEHWPEERDYVLNFARLHHLAKRAGTRFLPRNGTVG